MGAVVCCLFGRNGCDRAAEGTLGAVQRLARGFGAAAAVLIVGPPGGELLERAATAADAVHTLDDPTLGDDEPERLLDALARACAQLEPVAVLLGGDPLSQELAPRLAHRLQGSATGDAVALGVVEGEVRVTRPVYGGKAQAVLALRRAPAVVWLRARALEPAIPREGGPSPVSVLRVESQENPRVRVVARHVEAREATRLEDARWIVSGGRGLGGPEPFERLRELADVLGAQVAASRAACDAGWVPPSWQVGQTGKKVAPELYLAIAISGASQHLMGIADARVIAAINTDRDAPIFKHCRFGLVEDYRKVVGPLREQLAGLFDMNPADATRTVFWNVNLGRVWVMYALLAPTIAVGGYGFFRRFRNWRRGQPEPRFDQPLRRLAFMFRHGLLQQRTWRQRYAGTLHAMIFWGFVVLTIATIVVLIDYDFRLPIMRGWFYLVFQSFLVDLFGVLACVGVAMAAWRRLVQRPPQLVESAEAWAILMVIAAILVTGFLVEGWRIAVTNDPWRGWSPFGSLVAAASRSLFSLEGLRGAHRITWWLHMLLVFGFLAWAPYTKLAHVLTAVLNLYTARLEPQGAALKPLDLDTAEVLGVNSLAGFTWKDLLDFDSCTECGRCTAACPAQRVGKPLSPRDLILDLQRLAHQAADWSAPLIGTTPALGPEALWACTTCAACVDACPVAIEPLVKIVDQRRHLVMEQTEFPDTMQDALASLEARGHPFAGSRFSRLDWLEGLAVPVSRAGESGDFEVLLWVGCGGALVERNQRVIRALAELLHKAGVKFAILGRDEKCTGDPARRIGHEFLFQTLARDNIATLTRNGVRKIVTACPHCFNTFRHEYPPLGGAFEVHHHSEFLASLVQQGKLSATGPTAASVTTFHDPCYLGRHNGVYDPPRRLLNRTTTAPLVEMEQSRRNSFCCGGGGGLSFIDEPPDQRVNQERARQALATGADVIAVGCPFCMTMLEDGVNSQKGDRSPRVLDVAEVLWEAVRVESTARGEGPWT